MSEVGDCHRRRLAAMCGRYCGTCKVYLDGECCGCGYCLGRGRSGDCALFSCCAVERGLAHCGQCVDFPCQLYLSHARAPLVAVHIKALHRRTEIGTEQWLDEQEEGASSKE